MKYGLTILAVLALVAAVQCAGLYSKNSNVIQLDPSNFHQVFEGPEVWLVEFYAPWCGHCKSLTPAWEAAATKLQGIVKVAAVNCDEHQQMAGMFGVKGFPTLKLFPSKQSPNPHQKGLPWKEPEDYQGQRTAPAIVNHAISKLPNVVASGKKLDAFMEFDHTVPQAILFSEKSKVPNLFKGLAVTYKERIDFAFAASSKAELVEQFNVESFPQLVVVKTDGSVVLYEDSFKHAPLDAFLSQFAPSAKKSSGSGKKAQEPEKPVEVTHIESQEQFEAECTGKRGMCAIAVLDPEDDMTDEYLKIALATAEAKKKSFRWMWIDGTQNPTLVKDLHLDSGFPQYIVLNAQKKFYARFVGAFRQDKIATFLDKVLLGSRRLIAELDDVPTLDQ